MKDFFKSLFEYTYHYNDKVIEALMHALSAPEKSILLINHTVNAQEIWNARIEEKECGINVWELRPIDVLKEINKNNYEKSLDIIRTYDFDRIVAYKNSKGIGFSNTVQDMLFHAVNHSTYHRGQIATDFKNNGLTPISSDYIFHKR